MNVDFRAHAWFWIVAGDESRRYASARNVWVGPDDADYQAFLALDNQPSRIASLAELADVLRAQAPGLRPEWLLGCADFVQPAPDAYSADQLKAYANSRQWALATGGYTIALSGKTCLFATDPESLTLITGKAVRLGQPDPPATINWQFPSGLVTLTSADFMTAANAVADFVQGTFDTLLVTVLPGIEGGTISTREQIDAAFA